MRLACTHTTATRPRQQPGFFVASVRHAVAPADPIRPPCRHADRCGSSGARGPSLAPRLHFAFPAVAKRLFSFRFTTETRCPSLDVCLMSGLPSPAVLPDRLDHSKPGVIRERNFPSSFLPYFAPRASPRASRVTALVSPGRGGSFRPDPADGLRVDPARFPTRSGSRSRGGRVRRPVSLPYRFRHA